MRKIPVAILISGRGTNMTALIQAAHAADYPAEIVLVLSNRPDAPGLVSAQDNNIPTRTIDHRPFKGDRAAHEHAIDAALRAAGAEQVCLAGYMRLLTPFLTEAWQGKMLNIHPSLLPAFPGLHTHARALAAGAKLHGCTVHLVTATMDDGPILGQAAVEISPDDTEASLADRVLQEEHILYPKALRQHLSQGQGAAAKAPCNPLGPPAPDP